MLAVLFWTPWGEHSRYKQISSWLLLSLCLLASTSARKRRTSSECALYGTHKDDVYLYQEPVFIELEPIDLTDEFSVEMKVIASPYDHNGNLFAIGNKRDYPYYERKNNAVNTQFLVLEIVYSSVTLTLKSLGTYNVHSIELSWAGEQGYDIGDGQWHTVKAWKSPCCWHLTVDDIEISESIMTGSGVTANGPSANTNVFLEQQPGFLGGRPGYFSSQFMGVIRDVMVNGQSISLGDKEGSEDPPIVASCNSRTFRKFTTALEEMPNPNEVNPWLNGGSSSSDSSSSDTSMTSFFKHMENENRRKQQEPVRHPYPGIGRR